MKIGVFTGNVPAEITAFETWLGKPVDFVTLFGGEASWSDYVGSLGWVAGLFKPLGRDVHYAVPFCIKTATLAQCATGSFDTYYTQAAQQILGQSPGANPIVIRPGWEFNGNWETWSAPAKGTAANYVTTFKRLVDRFRAVSPRFRFEWNIAIGWNDPTPCYPGDNYVDYYGMDFYSFPTDGANPAAIWNAKLNGSFGLTWLDGFAAAHGKPMGFAEWGVQADGMGAYIASFAAWCATRNVAYQSYWDSNAGAYPGKLSSGQYPAAGAAFRAAFGTAAPPPPPPPPEPTIMELAALIAALQAVVNQIDARLDALEAAAPDATISARLDALEAFEQKVKDLG